MDLMIHVKVVYTSDVMLICNTGFWLEKVKTPRKVRWAGG